MNFPCNISHIFRWLAQHNCSETIVHMFYQKILDFQHKLRYMFHTYICSCHWPL